MSLPRISTPPTGERSEAKIKLESSTVKLPTINRSLSTRSSMDGIVEIEWILSIVREAHEKLALLLHLNPEIMTMNYSMTNESEKALQDFFTDLADLKEAIEEEEDEEEIEDLQEAICLHSKTVSRLLVDAKKTNPHLLKAVRKVKAPVPKATAEFITTMKKLSDLMQHKLKMTGEMESTMHGQLDELVLQEKEDSSKYALLKKKLDDERQEHSQIISGMDYKIDRLRRQMKRIKDDSNKRYEASTKRWALEEKRRQEAFEKQYKEKSDKLAKMKKEFDDKADDNFSKELRLHNIKYKKEAELEAKIKMYDKDVFHLHAEFAELQAKFNDEQDELKELETHFRKKAEHERAVEEERKKHAEARNKYITMKRIQRDAALLLQSLYKAWWVKNKKAAGGKDGKKGKK